MGELEEKLNAVLSNPESMAQVMQMAQQLSSSFTPQQEAPVSAPPPPLSSENPGGLGSLLGGIDPKLVGKLLPLLQEYGKSNSQTMQLLYALRPFLKAEKQDKIERAAQLARIIHVGKKFLTEWEG